MIRCKLAGRASTFRIARMFLSRFYSCLQRSLGACPGRGVGRLRGPRHHPSRHKMLDPDLVIGNDVSSDARLREIASEFSEVEYVEAVVLAGSAAGGTSDSQSDYDLYVYSRHPVNVAFRENLLRPRALRYPLQHDAVALGHRLCYLGRSARQTPP